MFDIVPSRMGIQLLIELTKNAINKGKLYRNDQSKYNVAAQKYELGVSTKSQKLKDEAKKIIKGNLQKIIF
jgi:hypothetical protein